MIEKQVGFDYNNIVNELRSTRPDLVEMWQRLREAPMRRVMCSDDTFGDPLRQ